jgi:hypothetical protein
MSLKEIMRPDPLAGPPYKPSTAVCPRCNSPMVHGPVACPDNLPGCCVLHWGYTCTKCTRQFT